MMENSILRSYLQTFIRVILVRTSCAVKIEIFFEREKKMKTVRNLTILISALCLLFCLAEVSEAAVMGTAFTYQGHLYDANHVANGLYDFQFKLFDDVNVVDGNQVGSDVNIADIEVIDGYFTAELDFGSSVFDGDARWLDIGIRPGELEDPNYTTLSPRQEMTAAPHSFYARKAGDSASIEMPYSGSVSTGLNAFMVTNTGGGKGIVGVGTNNDGLTGASFVPFRSGVFGYNDAVNGYGVFGSSNEGKGVLGHTHGSGRAGFFEITNPASSSTALEAVTDGNGIAIRGSATGTSGPNYGVYGSTDSNDGYAGYFTGGRNYFEGKIGIGTTSPDAPLSIQTAVGAEIAFTSSGTNADIMADSEFRVGTENNSSLSLLTDKIFRLRISGIGNVGIGILSPDEKLHVNGNIKISDANGGVIFSDGSKQTTASAEPNEVYFSVKRDSSYTWPDTASERMIDFSSGSSVWENEGNGFDTSTSSFIAPADGTYTFNGAVYFQNITAGNLIYAQIAAGGKNYRGGYARASGIAETVSVSITVHLDAGEYASLRAYAASTPAAEVYGNTSSSYAFTYFSGARVF